MTGCHRSSNRCRQGNRVLHARRCHATRSNLNVHLHHLIGAFRHLPRVCSLVRLRTSLALLIRCSNLYHLTRCHSLSFSQSSCAHRTVHRQAYRRLLMACQPPQATHRCRRTRDSRNRCSNILKSDLLSTNLQLQVVSILACHTIITRTLRPALQVERLRLQPLTPLRMPQHVKEKRGRRAQHLRSDSVSGRMTQAWVRRRKFQRMRAAPGLTRSRCTVRHQLRRWVHRQTAARLI